MYVLKLANSSYLFDFGMEWVYWTDELDMAYKMERLIDAEMTQKFMSLMQGIKLEIIEVKK